MSDTATAPEGFGGWLLLVVIGQWLGVLRALVEFAWALPGWAGQWADPALHRATVGEAALALGLLAFMVYTAIVMNLKRETFPTLFRIEAVLYVVVPLLQTWWVSKATGTPVDGASFAGVAAEAVAGTVGASISILYSLRSERVRNTFIH